MTTRLTRTRSVLTLDPRHRRGPVDYEAVLSDDPESHAVAIVPVRDFGYTPEENVDNPTRARCISIDESTFVDLGEPEQITVTIHPGDLLNAEADADGPEPTFGDARFEPVQRADGRWDWRLVHANGNVLCGSDQGYETRSMAFEIGRRCLSGGYMVTATEWE